jgi:GH15 family glucan-1,4-alpha-glucosidase
MAGLDLGVIGNCTVAALVDSWGRMVWSCFPQFDGDPVFCRLLTPRQDAPADDAADWGHFTVELMNQTSAEQSYLENTAVLSTRLSDGHGNAIEIIDFAPRFARYERMFRPPMVVRRVAAISGHPRIRVRLRPRFGHGALEPQLTRGSNHLRYVSPSLTLRLTTNAPVSYIRDEIPFLLDGSVELLFGSDEAVTGGIDQTARDFFERTCDAWRTWVRALSIPFEWQDAVIRAAITLKLCNYEETGAIVAALTTSIPEAPGTMRNWDYRFCWLRDAYFVVHALNGLGVTRTMEDYLNYIANIAGETEEYGLRPVYSIARNTTLTEWESPDLGGYRGHAPVRFGNQAHEQVQNDVYGSVVLASTQLFFDRRLVRTGNRALFERLERLGRLAARVFDRPDAGPWEFRTKLHLHTFSAVMCWSACDRLAKIAVNLGLPDRARHWRQQADEMHAAIVARSWNPQLNSFVAFTDGEEIDATLLLLHELDFLDADDPRFVGTVEAVERTLKRDGFLLRYKHPDDFGLPHTAFIICTFWYIDALATIGRKDEARKIFERVLAHRNALGLLSEDVDPANGELWGNFPQTYSMVGLINAATRLSKSWDEAF